jgi:hypothetical protein
MPSGPFPERREDRLLEDGGHLVDELLEIGGDQHLRGLVGREAARLEVEELRLVDAPVVEPWLQRTSSWLMRRPGIESARAPSLRIRFRLVR